ncbi:MAG: hypothetical protein ABI253_04035 [Mycobacterium sp.]
MRRPRRRSRGAPRGRAGRLATYLQAYADVLVHANGWDPAVWERMRATELFTNAAAAGPIDASASVATLEQLDAMIPAEWRVAAATGSRTATRASCCSG